MTRPYTPETLAKRWDVSATMIRNMCASGDLQHFRLGKLYRIPVKAVEEHEECQQNSPSDGSEGASPSRGMLTANEGAISLRHAHEKKQKPKRAMST